MSSNVNLTELLEKIVTKFGVATTSDNTTAASGSSRTLFIQDGSNKSDTIVIKDSNGGDYTVSINSLKGYLTDAEYNALLNNSNNSAKVPEKSVGKSAKVSFEDRYQGADIKPQNQTQKSDLEKEIDELKQKQDANVTSMTSLKEQIENLKNMIERATDEAKSKMEDIEEEQKKKAEDIVNQQLKKFRDSDGVMSQDEFNASVKTALSSINPSMSDALSSLMSAHNHMALMSNLVSQLGKKIEIDNGFSSQINAKQLQLKSKNSGSEVGSLEQNANSPFVQLLSSEDILDSSPSSQFRELVSEFGQNMQQQLNSQIDSAYSQAGFTKESVKSYKDFAQQSAEADGAKIADELEAREQEELKKEEKEE